MRALRLHTRDHPYVLLKVSQMQNEFMRSLFLPNASQKLQGFLPYHLINFQGRNPWNFWLTVWEKRLTHKFIQNFTDLYEKTLNFPIGATCFQVADLFCQIILILSSYGKHEMTSFQDQKIIACFLNILMANYKHIFFIRSDYRGVFFQFLFWWIYYCHSSKSTGKETSKTHLCALL